MEKTYNIAPDGKAMIHTKEEIVRAAASGMQVLLNVGKYEEPIKCRIAAVVRGWCTLVSESGGIFQAWAGDCYCYVPEKESPCISGH